MARPKRFELLTTRFVSGAPQLPSRSFEPWCGRGFIFEFVCGARPTSALPNPSCSVPECEGIRQTDPAFREALWARYFMAAPRPRTPSELRYSDRRLRSKSLRHSMG